MSGNAVDVTRAARRTFLGGTYYFERETTALAFERNPWAYVCPGASKPLRSE